MAFHRRLQLLSCFAVIYWCTRWVAESRYGHKWPVVFYTRTFNVMTSQSRVGLTVSRSLTSLGRFDVIVIVNMVATRKPFAWLTKCCRVVVKENVCDASDQHFWRPPLWPPLIPHGACTPFRFAFFSAVRFRDICAPPRHQKKIKRT